MEENREKMLVTLNYSFPLKCVYLYLKCAFYQKQNILKNVYFNKETFETEK